MVARREQSIIHLETQASTCCGSPISKREKGEEWLTPINHLTGQVEPGKRVRTRRKALETLYEEFFEHMDTRKTMRIAVLHGDALHDAEAIAARIQREFSPAELLMNITGPVLGVHTGPRAVALVGYTEG